MNKRAASYVQALCIVAVASLGACRKEAPAPAKAASPVAAPVAKGPAPTQRYAIGATAHCPVTGEDFVVSDKTAQLEHDGHYYAFCCADCQPTFEKNPDKYAKK